MSKPQRTKTKQVNRSEMTDPVEMFYHDLGSAMIFLIALSRLLNSYTKDLQERLGRTTANIHSFLHEVDSMTRSASYVKWLSLIIDSLTQAIPYWNTDEFRTKIITISKDPNRNDPAWMLEHHMDVLKLIEFAQDHFRYMYKRMHEQLTTNYNMEIIERRTLMDLYGSYELTASAKNTFNLLYTNPFMNDALEEIRKGTDKYNR